VAVKRHSSGRERGVRGHRQRDRDLDAAPGAHAAQQPRFAVARQGVEDGELVRTDPPHRAQDQRAGDVIALNHHRGGVGRRHPEAATDDVVEDRQKARCRVDSRPAQPGDVALGIDESGGASVGQERVLADGVLHRDGGQPGIVSAMLAIFDAHSGSLA
jgi:hypothetical protein